MAFDIRIPPRWPAHRLSIFEVEAPTRLRVPHKQRGPYKRLEDLSKSQRNARLRQQREQGRAQ